MSVAVAALENRKFLRRATTFLAQAGAIRQFIDIGSGPPADENIHQIAQGIAPESRVVYVDNDPLVTAQARTMLSSSPEGRTTYLQADLREPEKILANAGLQDTLDLARPVGLMLLAVLHHLDDAEALAVVQRLLGALPAGSYLVASRETRDFAPDEPEPREPDVFAQFFDGLELVEPGIVAICDWRSDTEPEPRPAPADTAMYGAVARKLHA